VTVQAADPLRLRTTLTCEDAKIDSKITLIDVGR
jgi:hypothetical protein